MGDEYVKQSDGSYRYPDGSVVDCSCKGPPEDGEVVQCDTCAIWMHCKCVDVNDSNRYMRFDCGLCKLKRDTLRARTDNNNREAGTIAIASSETASSEPPRDKSPVMPMDNDDYAADVPMMESYDFIEEIVYDEESEKENTLSSQGGGQMLPMMRQKAMRMMLNMS